MSERSSTRLGVIFDNDGTLLDTERLSASTLIEVVKEWFGIEGFDLEPYRRKGGKYLTQIARDLGHERMANAFKDEIHIRIGRVVERGLEPMSGAVALIEGLKEKGVVLGVASQTAFTHTNHRLVSAGLRDYFDAVSGGNQVRYGKPHQGLLHRVADQMGVNYFNCTVMGDMDTDIIAAIRAGMGAIKVSPDPFIGDLRYRDLTCRWEV